MASSPKPYLRSDRVSDRVHHILANIFIKEYPVNYCDLVTVTKVEVTRNLRLAKIYLSFIGADIGPDEIIKLISNDIKHIRYLLGKELDLKYVPDIKFYYDKAIKNIDNMNSILRKI